MPPGLEELKEPGHNPQFEYFARFRRFVFKGVGETGHGFKVSRSRRFRSLVLVVTRDGVSRSRVHCNPHDVATRFFAFPRQLITIRGCTKDLTQAVRSVFSVRFQALTFCRQNHKYSAAVTCALSSLIPPLTLVNGQQSTCPRARHLIYTHSLSLVQCISSE
jgi:hypothetical protein